MISELVNCPETKSHHPILGVFVTFYWNGPSDLREVCGCVCVLSRKCNKYKNKRVKVVATVCRKCRIHRADQCWVGMAQPHALYPYTFPWRWRIIRSHSLLSNWHYVNIWKLWWHSFHEQKSIPHPPPCRVASSTTNEWNSINNRYGT